jgi:tryptophan 2,3-dioxygenase
MTTLMDLYHNGLVDYLVRSRVVSTTILSYIHYYEDFNLLKMQGKTYREAVRLLSIQHHVSETTIKKGIRIVTAAERQGRQESVTMGIAV